MKVRARCQIYTTKNHNSVVRTRHRINDNDFDAHDTMPYLFAPKIVKKPFHRVKKRTFAWPMLFRNFTATPAR